MDMQFVLNCFFSVGMLLIGALGTVCMKYLNDAKGIIAKELAGHDRKILAVETRIDDVGKGLSDFRIDVQKEFVSREDHIRISQALDAKLDRLLNEIHKVDKNVTRIAAAQGLEHE